MTQEAKKGILSLDAAVLGGVLADMGQPAFRAKQLFEWLHEKGAADFSEMSNLPAGLRAALGERFFIEQPVVEEEQKSADGTVKYLLRFADGQYAETVLMQYKYGASLCVSSQVGCRMGCDFCASAKGGFVRDLTAGEMAGEVYAVQKTSGLKVARIVLMGMGEPLDNYDNVLGFIRLITSPEGQDVSGRHISLSTCGLVPEIEKLAQEKLPLTLSVSLHAANDETRSGMMPVNRRYPLAQLIKACRAYQKKTGRRVSFEYAMIAGVNDRPADAEKLAALLKGMGAHVNLIPANPVAGARYGASAAGDVEAFRLALEKRGVTATVRRRLGADIDAACGQLRGKRLEGG